MADPVVIQERRRGLDAMMRHKILILSADPSTRRALKRLMTATGAVTEFISDLSVLPPEPPSLIAVDLRGETAPRLSELAHVFPEVRLICIIGEQDFGQMVECLQSPRCGSVITFDDQFEPEDFIITVTKLLHGQVFGLSKYFPWGVTLYNMEVGSYDEKVQALEVLNSYAELAGARAPVRDRMALVAEELMINALYHAPVDGEGKPLYQHLPRKDLAGRTFEKRIQVACASNGHLFAISVRDGYGSLDKATVIKFLSKGAERSLTPEQKVSGAGLGLVTMLRNANKLVFNLAPNSGAEVIALFDLDLSAKARPGVRAVHIFTERRRLLPVPDGDKPRSLQPSTTPLLVGALAILLILFGVVGMVRRLQEPPLAQVEAEVQLPDGESRDVPLRLGRSDVVLKVERRGSNLRITTER